MLKVYPWFGLHWLWGKKANNQPFPFNDGKIWKSAVLRFFHEVTTGAFKSFHLGLSWHDKAPSKPLQALNFNTA